MRRFKILLTVLPETRTANDFLSPRRSARRGLLVGVPGCTLVLATLLGALAWNAPANNSVHTTWLWHLHQPIYWPDKANANHSTDHYQNAWDTMQLQDSGFNHPVEQLRGQVFSVADRIAAYQYQPKNTLAAIGSTAPNSG